jgi:hypothetical protein
VRDHFSATSTAGIAGIAGESKLLGSKAIEAIETLTLGKKLTNLGFSFHAFFA